MKKSSLRIMKDGRPLYGTAAQLHKISKEGGWDAYHEKVVNRVTQKVTKEVLKELNTPILRIAK